MSLKPVPVSIPAPVKPVAPGRPKDLGKGLAILEAAKDLFTTQGFDGVSMDQIAAEAGVSKLTVYSHYGDKENLFAAAVKSYCEQQLPESVFEVHPETGIRDRLLQVARAFHAMVASPEAIAGHRIMCTPRMTESHLPQLFWEAGPMRVQAFFAELLRRRMALGELQIDDIPRASAQFFCLLKGEPHAMQVFGCGQPSAAETRHHLAASVDLFLRAYAPR